MRLRKLFTVAATSLLFTAGAMAQTDGGTPSQPESEAKAATKPVKKKTRKKSSKRSRKKKSAPSKASTPSASAIEIQAQNVPDDGEAPQLRHQAVASGSRGKPLTIAAHAADANGVFGPMLYVRKRGLGGGDYVPIRMGASKIVPGDYAADVPAALTNVDAIEYYIEAWDMAGNGPARAGSADQPLTVELEEEKRPVAPAPPTNVTIKPKGAPPAITHAAVMQGIRGKPIEINARLVGDTGVQGATVMFRRVGEREYKALPMGNIGGDDYTATIPAAMATADLEYYVEAFDQYGNGPARSGAPNVPYLMKLSEDGPAPVSAVAAAPLSVERRVLEEESADNTIIGLGIDGGAPGGGGLTLLVRPFWWLRLNAGLAYNVIGFGYRGGITLAPGQWTITPTLNLDAGRYLSGDFNKFVNIADPNERSLLSKTTYTFATAQVGLEFGSQRRFSFYLRGGLTYLTSTVSGAALTAVVNGNSPDPSNTFQLADAKFSAIAPCASLGFNIFVY
jgi:hypothetical protein